VAKLVFTSTLDDGERERDRERERDLTETVEAATFFTRGCPK